MTRWTSWPSSSPTDDPPAAGSLLRDGADQHEHEGKGLGDPIGVKQHSRPSTASLHKWAVEVAADPARRTSSFGVECRELATALAGCMSVDLAYILSRGQFAINE